MKSYKLRLDIKDGVSPDVYRTLETKYFNSYVRSIEGIDSENTHYHYYVETLANPPAIRQYIRDKIGAGNGSYSLKELDELRPMEYLSYICKSDKNPVFYNLPYQLQQDVIEYSKNVSEQVKDKKKSRLNKRDHLFAYLDEKLNSIPCYRRSEERVMSYVYDYYVEEKLLFRETYMISLVQTYLAQHDPSYKEGFCHRLVTRMTMH